jgi:tetratricopeptide (TPR) repeat protein
MTMPRSRLIVLGAVTVGVALALMLGGVLREGSAASGTVPSGTVRQVAAAADALVTGVGVGSGGTAATIRRLEAQTRREDAGARAFTLLGLAYQQRARETADAAFYGLSERALRRAVTFDPADADAVSGLGSLALARHRFLDALELGNRAHRLAPHTARHLGVVGDALLELGRYRQAFATFDRMVALRPGLGGYARVSYARELLGDTDGALAAMRLALGPAAGLPEPTAWVRAHIAKLHWGRADVRAAGREYRLALRALPGYVYALDGLARVEVALGRRERAVELSRRAVDAMPLPELAGTLGDLLHTSGRKAEARRQYALVGAIERVLEANGVRTDLETALFDIDHGVRLRQALDRARAGYAERRSVVAEDTLAWALARNGRCEDALGHSRRALRLGTRDASIYFHRGYAERCAGRPEEARRWFARALELNPHFSLLWAPAARKALA